MADTNIDIKQSKAIEGEGAKEESKGGKQRRRAKRGGTRENEQGVVGELRRRRVMRRRVMRRRVYGQQRKKEREYGWSMRGAIKKKKRPTVEVDLSLNEASASEFQIIQQL